MGVPKIANFDAVRKALGSQETAINTLKAEIARLRENKDQTDQETEQRFVLYGARIAVITEEVNAATSLLDLGGGRAVLTHKTDPTALTNEETQVFNIGEDRYTVGTRVGLIEVAGSYFIISDSGTDPVVDLPDVEFISPVGGSAFFDMTHNDYSLTLEVIAGTFAFSAGDSGVTNPGGASASISLIGTLTELNALLTAATTGTLTVTMTVPGVDTMYGTLTDQTTLRSSPRDSMGILITPASSAATPVDVQVFTSDDTWTKPANAVLVEIHAIGGGGSGASGRKGAAGGNRGGGGGGNGGRYRTKTFRASDLTGTVAVTIGVGNTSPGASQTTNTTNGNAGTAGTATTFGAYLRAHGGEGGTAGTDAAAGGLVLNAIQGGTELDGSANFSTFAGASGGIPSTIMSGGAGGLGGSIVGTTAGAGNAGGTGCFYSHATGFAGGTGGAAGANGNTGTAATTGTAQGGGGGGGGGGGSNTGSTPGGTGAAGSLYGGGGGGGGAATNSVANSGAGGNGANGICVVITYF
jgi:hypothetical protein